MKLGEAIRETVRTQDAARAGAIAGRLRSMGLNYRQSFDVVQRAAPGTELAAWDSLLYEADTLESRANPRGHTIGINF